MTTATITLIGGPTALIELDGFRLLTDPTFDGPGEYALSYVTLKKTGNPALSPDQIDLALTRSVLSMPSS